MEALKKPSYLISVAFYFLIAILNTQVHGHQQPSFPGQNANQPPPQHHQAHAQAAQQHNQNQQQQQQQVQHQQNAQQQADQRQFGGNEAQNAEHIKEHLDGKVDPTANMTPEQLQFHYFTMHDLDKNNRLDGVELIKAITHFHGDETQQYQAPIMKDHELENIVDSILREDDFNNDGYIDYAEFLKAQQARDVQAQQAAQAQQPPQQPQQ